VALRPTAKPDVRITPATAQNIGGTATAFAQRVVPTPSPVGLYVVKPGDTLSKIANNFATTIDEIMAANNLSDPNTIQIGQKLTIPSPDPGGAAETSVQPSVTGSPEATTADVTASPEAPSPREATASPEIEAGPDATASGDGAEPVATLPPDVSPGPSLVSP
jgi:LysM repeat protein